MGGVILPMIVDSGASCNVIGRENWEFLKSKNIDCTSSKDRLSKLYAYGSVTPLPIAGTFTTDVKANGINLYDIHFKVIEGQGQSLLGCDTAMKLNLLRLGPEQSEINSLQPIKFHFR